MACPSTCRLCDQLVISDAVAFVADTLTIDIPANNYGDGDLYCVVVAQSIPAETTITAPVAFTIGGDTATLYPFVDRNGAQIAASQIRTRTRYKTRVATTPTGGVFRYMGRTLSNRNNLQSIPAPAPIVSKTDSESNTNG